MSNIRKINFRKFGKVTIVVTKHTPDELKEMGLGGVKFIKLYVLTRSNAAALCYVRKVRGTMKTRVRVRSDGEFMTLTDTACFLTAVRAAIRYLAMMGGDRK